MGVYIKEMDMPTNADMTPTAVRVYPNGYAIVFKDNGRMEQYTKAVSVPPHGDLIDRDALVKELNSIRASFGSANGLVEGGLNIAVSTVNGRPTIIPASEEGE